VVVAHSLGTVVAFEALHGYGGPVELLVTLGSPLATGAAVLQRVRPRPARTPEAVGRWLNFWDRDDIVVARPRVQQWMLPSFSGVAPVTDRVDSDGVWVHTATKYLRQPAVAGPIIEVLKR
jgi:pimeloyl-ACP methyl ester carboxylesterase